MIIRRDLRPNPTVTPKELQAAAAKIGGKNPFGEPMYRIIRAEERITLAAGEWNIWADEVPVEDRGDLGIGLMQRRLVEHRQVIEAAIKSGFSEAEIKKITAEMTDDLDGMITDKLRLCPVKIIRGMDEVGLYPYEGWIIEKWRPASSFGLLSEWEAFRFDGSNALGPYPHNGEYELCAGPTPLLPTKRDIEDAIRTDMKNIEERPQRARDRVARMLEKLEQRQKQKERDRRNQIDGQVSDGPGSLHKTLSLGAGRVIQDLATKAGMKGHYGS
jgi:hypothetical protein